MALSIVVKDSAGINFDTYLTAYFAAVTTPGTETFYGGELTPWPYGGPVPPQNASGEQIVINYGSAPQRAIIGGEGEIAYDFIYHAIPTSHGFSGTLDSLTLGDWVDGVTQGTPGTGDAGLVTGLDEKLVISGFDLTAAPGTGPGPSNALHSFFNYVKQGDAAAIYNVIDQYALDITGAAGNDTFTGGALDDKFDGRGGNDTFDGGGGTDTAVFDGVYGGPSGTYSFVPGAGGSLVITDSRVGGTGVDTISNVEILKFENLTYNLNTHQADYTPTDIALNATEISETAVVGTIIGILTATDTETGTLTYSIKNDPDGKFAIVTNGGVTQLVLNAPLDYDQATSHSVDVTVTDSAGNTYTETFTIDVQEQTRITIDASNLNGVNFDTYIASYFSQVAVNGTSAFHGGTPDGMFGYQNGDQVTFRYRDVGDVSPEPFTRVVSLDGEDFSYDAIHYGSPFPHGFISGTLDSITFGAITGAEPAAGAALYTNYQKLLTISGIGITSVPGSGGSSSANIVPAMYYAIRSGNAASIDAILDRFAQEFSGSSGDDRYTGTAFDDVVKGNGGNDRLDGSAGADLMIGGAGDDIYFVDNVGDSVQETGSGDDKVWSSVSYTLSAKVERLVLTGTDNINATGNSLANTIRGNDGNNILDGKAGADTMSGVAGDDTYYVDDAGDVVKETANAGSDKVFASVSFALSANVENLELTGIANINGTGNSLKNEILGNSGNNVLDGKGGADSMKGGAGHDTYYVDNAGDVVRETSNAGTDKVFASISYTLVANTENLELIGSANIDGTGNAVANAITGNAGDNVLDGKGGSDTMIGGAGADTFVFSTVLNAATNVDTIVDFVVADDTIMLSQRIFSGLSVGTLPSDAFHIGAAAADASDRIIYDSSTGDLFYDADGSGGGAAVKFAILSTGLALTQDDFIIV